MIIIAIVCVALLTATTVIHYEVLRALTLGLPALRVPVRARLIVVILAAFCAHALEMLLYGLAIYTLVHLGLGVLGDTRHSSLDSCLYFSAETYTSLGFGDVVPVGPLRALAGVESLNGLLLIGWSASYAYIAMERFWNDGDGARR